MSRELDAEVVEKIMGGFTDDPDTGSTTGEIRYYLHPRSGVLKGIAFEYTEIDPGYYDRMWVKWHPSTDIVAAWEVVDHLRAQQWVMTLSVNHYVTEPWDCRFFLEQDGLLSKRVIAHGPTAPEAICRAALATIE